MSGTNTEVKRLLQQVQDAALDPNTPVADALRLCLAAGGRLGSTELRDWAKKELNGYDDDDELPPYRIARTAMLMDYVLGKTRETGRPVTKGMVSPDVREWMYDCPLRMSIAEVSASALSGTSSTFASSNLGGLATMIRSNTSTPLAIQRVYWSLDSAVMAGVVDQVRTRLVEVVAEFDLGLDAGAPPKTAASRAVSVVIGDGSTVTLNAIAGDTGAVTTAGGPPAADLHWWDRGWWTVTRGVWAVTIGVATLAGTWATLVSAGLL